MTTFTLEIFESDSTFYQGEAESLTIPAGAGEYGVLAHHENIVIAIVPGILHFKPAGGEVRYASVSSGVMRVENNHVLVLVETAERPEEIDENRAQAAAEAAQEELLSKESLRAYQIAEVSLQREIARLKLKRHLNQMG